MQPYRVIHHLGPKGNLHQPKLLLHTPHGAVSDWFIRRLMDYLQLPESQWPAYFRWFCNVNGDQGSNEYSHRVAELLTNPQTVQQLVQRGDLAKSHRKVAIKLIETMSIVHLEGQLHRSVIDLNRAFDGEKSTLLTPPVPDFITQQAGALAKAHDLLQQAQQQETYYYQQVCQTGGYGVLNAHTYMPLNMPLADNQPLYEQINRLFTNPAAFDNAQQIHGRPSAQLITADGKGKQLAHGPTTQALLKQLKAVGYEDIICNAPFYHMEAAACSRWAAKYPHWVNVLEIRRDCLLSNSSQYRKQLLAQDLLTLCPQRVDQTAWAIATGLLQGMLARSMKTKISKC